MDELFPGIAQGADLQSVLNKVGEDNLAIWVLNQNLYVDHRPFNFDRHRYLIDIYSCNAHEIVVMKAAQMGLTIWMLLKNIHLAVTKPGIKLGFYFPTSDAIVKLSKDRLTPLILKNPSLKAIVDANDTFTDTLGLKQIGDSSLYLSHIGGVATKDSIPLDAVSFDEVRLMESTEIDQTDERISHSPYKYKFFISTSGLPGTDIHARFLRGTQQFWHSKCLCSDNPQDWVCLPLAWPDCVLDTGEDVLYICPNCHAHIQDPQNGQYVAHNPGGDYPSFHVSQLISDYITPKEVWRRWNETTNIPEFWNAKLGLPYVDIENRPISPDVFHACINTALPWSWTKKELGPIGMGVDQRSGQNHVIIGQRINVGRNAGKKRIIHMEIVDSKNYEYFQTVEGKPKEVSPFRRLYELMDQFDVDCCVCDGLPNANDAQAFGRHFPKRVFLAYYQNQRDQMRWSDRPLGKRKKNTEPVGLRRVRESAKFEHHVLLDRYVSIEAALMAWIKRQVSIPDPKGLVQLVRNREGRFVHKPIVLEIFLPHLMGLIRQKTMIKDDGTYTMKWVSAGLDPHFAHAWNYCNAALERVRVNLGFTFLDDVETQT